MRMVLIALLLFPALMMSQDVQQSAIAPSPNASGKLRVFVLGNNATAVEVRRELESYTKRYEKKPDAKSKFCMILVDNPKNADAIFSVESIVNGRSIGAANYTSSAQLTTPDGTLLWSDSLGDGSKFMDVMVGGSPRIAGSRLLGNAAKKVCKER